MSETRPRLPSQEEVRAQVEKELRVFITALDALVLSTRKYQEVEPDISDSECIIRYLGGLLDEEEKKSIDKAFNEYVSAGVLDFHPAAKMYSAYKKATGAIQDGLVNDPARFKEKEGTWDFSYKNPLHERDREVYPKEYWQVLNVIGDLLSSPGGFDLVVSMIRQDVIHHSVVNRYVSEVSVNASEIKNPCPDKMRLALIEELKKAVDRVSHSVIPVDSMSGAQLDDESEKFLKDSGFGNN